MKTPAAALSVVFWFGIAMGAPDGREEPSRGGTSTAPSPGALELEAWKNATVREVSRIPHRHTIHSYYVTCPESPDGTRVLFYTSATDNGETAGDLRIMDRATGNETVIATGITAEDAHRAACQQWSHGGKYVVYHDFRDGHWQVVAVDAETRESRVLAIDRQVGFGSPMGSWIPVYGCHWNPGPHRDLELIHVVTGEVRKPVTIRQVIDEHGDYVRKTFGTEEISIFFPVMSPDEQRVFFKLSRPGGGDDFRAKIASFRQGKVVFDLDGQRFVRLLPEWGHPAWHPDSRRIIEKGNLLIDPDAGKTARLARSPNNHPSIAPDGSIFVTDADVSKRDGAQPGEWAIVVGPADADAGGEDEVFEVVHQFNNAGGAKTWRRNHPHPAFSADSRRIYFNVNDGPWTRLFVAERRD